MMSVEAEDSRRVVVCCCFVLRDSIRAEGTCHSLGS